MAREEECTCKSSPEHLQILATHAGATGHSGRKCHTCRSRHRLCPSRRMRANEAHRLTLEEFEGGGDSLLSEKKKERVGN